MALRWDYPNCLTYLYNILAELPGAARGLKAVISISTDLHHYLSRLPFLQCYYNLASLFHEASLDIYKVTMM